MTMPEVRVVVVGEGAIAEQLCRMLDTRPTFVPTMVVGRNGTSARLQSLAQKLDIPYRSTESLSDNTFIKEIRALAPHYILSADNFRIFREPLLRSALVGCVNFHNGPLPMYRGVNIPSWAIWNGETAHAITWHVMERGLDSGPVLLSTPVHLDDKSTAATLTMDCMLAGLNSLPGLLERLSTLELPVRTHPERAGRYYGKGDIPADGLIDPTWPMAKIDRLVRALDYGRIPAQIGPAQIEVNGVRMPVRTFRPQLAATPGEERSTPRSVRLNCREGTALFELA